MLSCVELDKLGVHKNADFVCGFAMQNINNKRPNHQLTRATVLFFIKSLGILLVFQFKTYSV